MSQALIQSDRFPISDADPSFVARVSGRGAVTVSRLCAWWWGFRWRCKALSLIRVFSLGFLILGFALALPFDDWGGRVFVLGFFILFYFIFYILYFINFYKFILIFYFFKNTFGFVWDWCWVLFLGLLCKIQTNMLCKITRFYNFFFFFWGPESYTFGFGWHKILFIYLFL